MNLRQILPVLVAAGVAVLLFLPSDVFAIEPEIEQLDHECVTRMLKNCKVLTSGRINFDYGEHEGEPMLVWQTQSGFTDEDGSIGGFVVYSVERDRLSFVGSGFDGYRFAPPRLSTDGSLLHVPGYTGGTGAYNADRLYKWGDTGAARYIEAWRPVDIDTWRRTIDEQLPEGLEIWKGVDYDFDDWFYGALNARTPLWRADDGNCCPSGGWATIHFDIDDLQLVVTDIDYIPPVEQ
ncbi:MAG: hypothetical protein ABS76_06785 [Pelagibacterium sp. SCN 64-44]|nr:MAG: hypothetical protein ABS76_06785 [Pelagibacterium sp. SCN 64-44]